MKTMIIIMHNTKWCVQLQLVWTLHYLDQQPNEEKGWWSHFYFELLKGLTSSFSSTCPEFLSQQPCIVTLVEWVLCIVSVFVIIGKIMLTKMAEWESRGRGLRGLYWIPVVDNSMVINRKACRFGHSNQLSPQYINIPLIGMTKHQYQTNFFFCISTSNSKSDCIYLILQ